MAESGFPFLAPLRSLGPARRAQVIEATPVRRQQMTGPRAPFRRMPGTARQGWRLGHRMYSRRRRKTALLLPIGASSARHTWIWPPWQVMAGTTRHWPAADDPAAPTGPHGVTHNEAVQAIVS